MTRICERMDCHSHSAYSGHGSGSVEDMVRRAEELGLAVFAQTEHLVLPEGMDPDFETSMSSQTMKRYIEELHEQRERLAHVGSGMQLICGIEADWLPDVPTSSPSFASLSNTCSVRFISSITGPSMTRAT